MKMLLVLALFVAMPALLLGLASAQTLEKSTRGTTSDRGKPTKEQMTGKVIEVNARARTFTVMAKGKAIVFSGAMLSKLPTAGEIVDITYTEAPAGGPPNSIMLNSSRSNIY